MNILFLVESVDNATASNLIGAFKQTEHRVDVIPYYNGGKAQCSIIEYGSTPSLFFAGKLYSPADYDAALLWCWGTADIGRKYLRLFEDQGVFVVNSTYDTEITDSKIDLTRMFENNNIRIPETLFFDSGVSSPAFDDNLYAVTNTLGSAPYVFKSDYSTQGHGIQFANSLDDVKTFAEVLNKNHPQNSGFILQKFVGQPEMPIFHYRVLVLGDVVFPYALKITASTPLKVSNIATGGHVELIPMRPDLEAISLQTAKASGLKMAGVDLMVEPTVFQKNKVVVLEINDGPGTKTFDRAGCDASGAVVQFFISYVERALAHFPRHAIR